ncbi:HD domain-containing protein [Penicillium angulare]|uniref:HD domain-containing protein n=1 Tax=Penicillium angulare TaxID=116970 RepID=UPI002542621E|nr:HD domain-containing protein [Penicillium angulare]KAJ5273269.1 HD domain-containing protein [Penicillium angulare]
MGSDDSSWSPQTALSTLPHPPEENSTSPVAFFHLIERLKTTKREGWRRFGISHGESISDHMYRMSIMTMLAPPELASKLNIPHCTKMALIHDMAESLVGDITPADNVTKSEKARREGETMDYIVKTLLGNVPGGALSGAEIMRVFQEYEDNQTPEAQFVHDIDKMELLLQFIEYERTHGVDLQEFEYVASKVQLPEIQAWAQQVISERPKYNKSDS